MNHSTDTPLLADELAEIRARAEKATPGPWAWEREEGKRSGLITERPARRSDWDDGKDVLWFRSDHYYDSCTITAEGEAADADFIAASRDDISRLLATVDALTARLDGPEQLLEATVNADGSTTVKRLACKNCDSTRSSEVSDAAVRKAIGEENLGDFKLRKEAMEAALKVIDRWGFDGVMSSLAARKTLADNLGPGSGKYEPLLDHPLGPLAHSIVLHVIESAYKRIDAALKTDAATRRGEA